MSRPVSLDPPVEGKETPGLETEVTVPKVLTEFNSGTPISWATYASTGLPQTKVGATIFGVGYVPWRMRLGVQDDRVRPTVAQGLVGLAGSNAVRGGTTPALNVSVLTGSSFRPPAPGSRFRDPERYAKKRVEDPEKCKEEDGASASQGSQLQYAQRARVTATSSTKGSDIGQDGGQCHKGQYPVGERTSRESGSWEEKGFSLEGRVKPL